MIANAEVLFACLCQSGDQSPTDPNHSVSKFVFLLTVLEQIYLHGYSLMLPLVPERAWVTTYSEWFAASLYLILPGQWEFLNAASNNLVFLSQFLMPSNMDTPKVGKCIRVWCWWGLTGWLVLSQGERLQPWKGKLLGSLTPIMSSEEWLGSQNCDPCYVHKRSQS